MRKILFPFVFLISNFVFSQTNFNQYVNPFIGTGGHGHTYPGAVVPHGMVQLSPDTRLEGWDGCGGYHYSDSFIYGFTHTHLSGTGCTDYGDILLMPGNGTPSPNNKIYGSLFSHNSESASPGYYKVNLLDDNIDVELTATERVGFHHYTFSKPENNYVILDLKHRDEVLESSLKIEDDYTISGLRRSKAWADNQYVYFVMKFSSPFKKMGIWDNDVLTVVNIQSLNNSKNIKAYFSFDLNTIKDVFVKVAISAVSVEGAKRNLEAEANFSAMSPARDVASASIDFIKAKSQAEEKWDTELSKIEVKGTDKNKLTVFYTSLYHTAVVPNINIDVDGQYRGRDNQIHKAEGFTYYSVFSLWDTYRAAHPLYTIIDQKRTIDYIKTFLVQYQQGGRLPVWELSSCETDCMIGYHSVPVIVDAYMKGINQFDTTLALQAMMKSANWNHLGLPALISNGMITVEDEHESVSKNLEYAYDDYCIAMYAKSIGNNEAYTKFIKRAQYYKNILDYKTGFVCPRKNGGWISPFDPREVNNHFTEANSWQYSFYFPQDINGYISMMGGKKKLETKLDALFNENSKTTGRDQSDITGLIGQYAHGNEPSHHIIYLYDYTGNPAKAQFYANKVMNEFYKNSPDGLIGNEDCGQMSAWYVMSALGFYPVTPGNNKYMMGSPQFSLAEIHLENGKSFIVNAVNKNEKNFYIQNALISTSRSLRPTEWKYPYLNHEDIANGGLVTFNMADLPVNCFTLPNNDEELSKMPEAKIVLNPIIEGGNISFTGKKTISISSAQKDVEIYYSTNGEAPGEKMNLYSHAFVIDRSMEIKAISIDKVNNSSSITTASYRKKTNNWAVKLITTYEPQYNGGGKDGLIDGIHGSTNWRMGNWQGYQLQNPEMIIDLKKQTSISKVSIGFLQDVRAWIVMPKKVSVFISHNGVNFEKVYVGENYIPIEDVNPQTKKVEAVFEIQPCRFIKIVAEQYGKLPSWHEGAGGDTHIFMDEVEVAP
jgi:predicted alpha-1,2-mannosidase